GVEIGLPKCVHFHVIRSNWSSIFTELSPGLPTDGSPWILEKLFGRGATHIVQQPDAANDFTLIIEFDDNPFLGSRYYGILLIPTQ
ncbi:hypothetical protein, partial [Candidatus Entotheonella palauensis]|uniref:hypothetical protein n=1 Tax=Candidatus Entotheonella palauensis TaxID=93172 RepID=UPI001C4DE884